MTIREARPEDAPQLARVHVDTWQGAYRGLLPDDLIDSFTLEKRIAQWNEWLGPAASGARSFVAVDDAGALTGFATAGAERGETGFQGELFGLYVKPDAQRRGAGRALTAAAARHLAASGYHSMVVWVLADNPACGFYERLGGRLVARQRRDLYGFAADEAAYGWDTLDGLI